MQSPSQLQLDQPGQSELQLAHAQLHLVTVRLQPNWSELELVCVQLQLVRAQLQSVLSSCNWSIHPIAIDVFS